MHIVFAIPSYRGLRAEDGRPRWPLFAHSLCDTLDALNARGDRTTVLAQEHGCYIQLVRNELVAQFLETDGDVLFFIDDDVSWCAKDALALIDMPDEMVAGTYRLRTEPEQYCGVVYTNDTHRPITREDGAMAASEVPTGFLRIRRSAIEKLVAAYPERVYVNSTNGVDYRVTDLFPQGLQGGRWVGEDLALCRLWRAIGGDIWLVPDIDITHGDIGTGHAYPGNFHEFMTQQPGGSKEVT